MIDHAHGEGQPCETWDDIRSYVLPTDQTTFANLDPAGGNCIQAIAATVVREPLDMVPNFYLFGHRWIAALDLFFSLWAISVEKLTPEEEPVGLTIAVGPSPRGVDHCVLCLNGEIIHDPHPSKAGLLSVKYHVQLWADIFDRIARREDAAMTVADFDLWEAQLADHRVPYSDLARTLAGLVVSTVAAVVVNAVTRYPYKENR